MTVFLILYECALFSSIVPPVYFPFELVLPVNKGGSVRGESMVLPGKGYTTPLAKNLSCVIPTFLPFLIPVIIFQRF